ncbi:MAG: UDP-N-acetylglucosamine 2-epimerase [Erysipelotrichaceae bacterium]
MKLAIVTSTRADYGLLKPILDELTKIPNQIQFYLIVTGTHLSKKYGMTINEIMNDNIKIYKKIEIPLANDCESDIANDMAKTLVSFTNVFKEESFDFVLLLGDRYEMLMIALAATLVKLPILHLYGGDTTEGAMDEYIRHSITKMSYIHFVSNVISKKRVIQLGENPDRVFCVGSTGIDNILNSELYDEDEIRELLSLNKNSNIALGTYHPVTFENYSGNNDLIQYLDALKEFKDIEFIITKSNSDLGGEQINKILDEWANRIPNLHVYSSLGMKKYLSIMRISEFVIGNSSSGLFETPSFKIPTINIGNRQKGRLQASSVINSDGDTESICKAITYALSDTFKKVCLNTISPFGDGHAAINILKVLLSLEKKDVSLLKKFYNIY